MMREYFILLILGLSLSSCATPVHKTNPLNTQEQEEASLFSIKILHKNTVQFSGIIGLEMRTEGVYCVLLDATGLSLFEAIVQHDGSMDLINSLEAIQKRRLPEVIASALWAIFLAPADDNCPWYRLHCVERKKNMENKNIILTSSSFSFLRLWQTTVTLENNLPDTVEYSLPFQNVSIQMNKIKE
jgi:hypothetical protein